MLCFLQTPLSVVPHWLAARSPVEFLNLASQLLTKQEENHMKKMSESERKGLKNCLTAMAVCYCIFLVFVLIILPYSASKRNRGVVTHPPGAFAQHRKAP
jgi:p-aminobenzoyl-glutamate transporter AbgT